MIKVEDIANFFLWKESMSHKKLQKLVYYAYAWSIALLNDNSENIHFRLFNSNIEAWIHGPVIPELYQKYKCYGWSDIPKIDDFDTSIFETEVLDILEQVWAAYGSFSGNQLETISHREKPWLEARNGVPAYMATTNLISDKDMFIFYNEQANS
jgi:uncharacterized phage-associated protein